MNNMDVHEIYVWHSLIDHSVFETHIFEHVLYRYIDEEMKQSGLDQQGIIIQSETFLDGTYTEIFLQRKILGNDFGHTFTIPEFTKCK